MHTTYNWKQNEIKLRPGEAQTCVIAIPDATTKNIGKEQKVALNVKGQDQT